MLIRSTNYNNSNMMNSLMAQQSKLYELYNQVSTGQKFTNISENPMDSTSIMDLNKQLQKISTYENNIGFFAASKNSSPLIEQMRARIEQAKGELKELEMQIRKEEEAGEEQ